jgi:hypothetical protein
MVSLPEEVLEIISLEVDGILVKSISHLIAILCQQHAAHEIVTGKKHRSTKDNLKRIIHATSLRIPLTKIKAIK